MGVQARCRTCAARRHGGGASSGSGGLHDQPGPPPPQAFAGRESLRRVEKKMESEDAACEARAARARRHERVRAPYTSTYRNRPWRVQPPAHRPVALVLRAKGRGEGGVEARGSERESERASERERERASSGGEQRRWRRGRRGSTAARAGDVVVSSARGGRCSLTRAQRVTSSRRRQQRPRRALLVHSRSLALARLRSRVQPLA